MDVLAQEQACSLTLMSSLASFIVLLSCAHYILSVSNSVIAAFSRIARLLVVFRTGMMALATYGVLQLVSVVGHLPAVHVLCELTLAYCSNKLITKLVWLAGLGVSAWDKPCRVVMKCLPPCCLVTLHCCFSAVLVSPA